jgi:hypothetical protein
VQILSNLVIADHNKSSSVSSGCGAVRLAQRDHDVFNAWEVAISIFAMRCVGSTVRRA